MIPTFIGVFVLIAGSVLLVTASVPAMFAMLMICSLMPGSAALQLPALGGSSIPPTQFALGFMILRLLLPGSGQGAVVIEAARRNLLLLAFVAFGVAMAMLGPRIFAGTMEVIPMRMASIRAAGEQVPLGFSIQNVTSAIYLLGNGLIAVAASACCFNREGTRRFVRVGITIAWVHIFFGVTRVVFHDTAYDQLLEVFRNGNYAQTDQTLGYFSRMDGITPEPSVFAMIGFAWFVFLMECWLRDIYPRRTGAAAAAMAAVLLFSTSSTAYLGLGAYAVVLLGRGLFVPWAVPFHKALMLGLAALVAAVAISMVFLLVPDVLTIFTDMIQQMTVGKTQSDSGTERTMWALQGLESFRVSHGLGVGPGSFRSSSFATAMLGSTGVIGVTLFVAYVLKLFKPLQASTYVPVADPHDAVGVAASWAALMVLVPAAAISPSTDPGTEFAIFAGVALALRLPRLRSSTRALRSTPTLHESLAHHG